MSEPVFDTIAIIGVGLIGSSLARAIADKAIARQIYLHDADPATRARLQELALGEVSDSACEAVKNADLVIICTPPGRLLAVARACLSSMKPGAILSDTGSVKGVFARELTPLVPPGIALVPGHPVAGTERSGPDAGFAGLFEHRWCILTPCQRRSPAYEQSVSALRRFWEALGARVQLMDPQTHDRILALTSHMPHLIAYAMVATAVSAEGRISDDAIRFSGGGFRDFTRIAASDPEMWRDVFLQNPESVLEMLDSFSAHIEHLRQSVEAGDGEALFALFSQTRIVRERIVSEGQDTPKSDFGR